MSGSTSQIIEPRVLLEGLAIGESPRWHDDRLWFSNWGADEIIAVDLDGNSEVAGRGPEGLGWAANWLPDGRMLITGAELLRVEPDGSRVRHADLSHISRFGWSELTVDGRGNAYVNTVNFDFADFNDVLTSGKAPGKIALVAPDGEAGEVADELAFPNGMVVTPDNRTLIVAESFAGRLTAFDIDDDGSLSNRRTWADGIAPDGICLDADGAAWCADVPHQRCVRVAEGGRVLDSVDLDRGAFACMLGGGASPALYVVAAVWPGGAAMMTHTDWDGQVLRMPVEVPAAGWPATG
jgi:sugar lactone lactonase YvrE